MTIEDKAKILYDRHIKIIIEWGGTEFFTDFSNMSIEGMIKTLMLVKREDNIDNFNKILSEIVAEEDMKHHEQEN